MLPSSGRGSSDGGSYELSPVEYMYKRFNMWQPILWFELRGPRPVTRSALASALWSASARHPLMRSVVADARSRSLAVPERPPPPDELPIARFVVPSTREDSQRAFAARACALWSSEHAWEAEAFASAEDGRCWVVMQWHHAAMDGRGSLAVLRDVVRSLNGEALGPSLSIPRPLRSRHPELAITDVPPDELERVAPAVASALAANHKRLRVSPVSEQLDAQKLAAACHERHVSVTATVAAAFGLAARAQEMACFLPVDLRGRDEEPELCFSVSNAHTPFVALAGRKFWDVARELHAAVRSSVASGAHLATDVRYLLDLWSSPAPSSRTTLFGQGKFPLCISNIGAVDAALGQSDHSDDPGKWALTELVPMGGNNLVPGAVVLWVCTLRGKLSVSSVGIDPPVDPDEMAALFSSAVALLRSL
eukprot:m51a1_g3815 hypothetical protein (422) ;mRNA; f:267052-268317